MNFETYADDDVEVMKFDLNYGKGLELTDLMFDYDLDNEDDGTYTYVYENPMPVNEAGGYVFKVARDEDVWIEFNNISFVIDDDTYITDDFSVDINVVKNYENEDDYIEYTSNSFYIQCYDKKSVDENNFKVADSVQKGDQIVCYVGYETYADDAISSLNYKLNYGKNLKLVDSISYEQGDIKDNQYFTELIKPSPVAEVNEFVFEVLEDAKEEELFIKISEIRFVTENGDRYSNEDNILKIKTK